MTLTLILTRHAKSAWDDPALDDFDRPLSKRGRRDARRIGRWLRETGVFPQRALASPALRTRETLAAIAPRLPAIFMDELFLAIPAAIATCIMAMPPERQILIAHNPGIGNFVEQYAKTIPDNPRFHAYPTAATTILDFDIDGWSDLRPGTGRVRAFVTPGDLAG